MKKLLVLAVFSLLLCAAFPAQADDILASKKPSPPRQVSAPLYSSLTVPQLCDLLKQWDSSCRAEPVDDVVKIRLDGINALFLLNDERDSLQYFVRFESDVPLDHVNLWNTEYRYARHYVQTLDDGTRVINMELDHTLCGGVSKKNIFEFFELARLLTATLKQNLEK
ncbi:YbjN domain-containing protein [uncultured Desulfovibrio sp.]|uniref:YbjN domain-containing protein n=1 Tax=uncultured Desulfovibrio sp. TaxID=167968 RepID=UPI00260E425D|nr:YbjN domain-containing protein [uncultured Desulfovibrio sp.]